METVAMIIPTMALVMNGPAENDILRGVRHHRLRLVVVEAMAKMMVQDDNGGEGRGKTGRTIMMEVIVTRRQVEGMGGMPRPGLDTRAKSMLLWRLRMQTQTPSKRPSIPFSMGNIPNPSPKRHLRPIPV